VSQKVLRPSSSAADRASTGSVGLGSRIHNVSAETPCAPFHKPLPRKRPLMHASRVFRSLTSGRVGARQVVRGAGVVAHGQQTRSGSMLPSPMARTPFSQPCAASAAWNIITWTRCN
jgi:hypothetical protein